MNFSIIIPTLNEADNIQSCLQSVQAQSQPHEIIIVDAGSVDNTLENARPLADKIIRSDKGRATQMNKGAKYASGDILLFLHADTHLPTNALDSLSQLFKQHHNTWGRFNITLTGQHPLLKMIAWFMNWRSCLTGIATGDQVIFVKKSLFEQVNGYAEIALMEDVELCSRLKKISRPHCLKTRVISSGRRWEQYGVVKVVVLMWSIRLRYFFGEAPETLNTLYTKGKLWKT
ncbi:MAG: glycosyltransferase family 2 protein [Methylococcales symbiont of Hymedesmia sp. n. MRB-2018]|nr:MAG: glycosyltransferase family 2 protein [Methylococcales symbiont of Hymedesmia sp. n. MRB-2018]